MRIQLDIKPTTYHDGYKAIAGYEVIASTNTGLNDAHLGYYSTELEGWLAVQNIKVMDLFNRAYSIPDEPSMSFDVMWGYIACAISRKGYLEVKETG